MNNLFRHLELHRCFNSQSSISIVCIFVSTVTGQNEEELIAGPTCLKMTYIYPRESNLRFLKSRNTTGVGHSRPTWPHRHSYYVADLSYNYLLGILFVEERCLKDSSQKDDFIFSWCVVGIEGNGSRRHVPTEQVNS